MGYFSEMSLDMQEGRKPSAASLTRECAFEDGESFDELPVPPADRQPAPPAAEPAPQPAFEDDGDLDEAPEELEQPDEAESPAEKTDEEDNADEGQAEPAKADASNADADEEQRRAEHEAAEAKRKAEWEAKQAEKKKALQEQMDRLAAMSDDEVVAASMQRVSGDVEKLTRRNMKECVSEYIQTKCLEDPAFARLTMHPKKTMVHCFQYISRKAWEYIQDELKANGIQPGQGNQGYGCDIPDDLCYQWSEDYFRDPDAKEDQEQEEKFVPRPYYGKSSVKSSKKKKAEKKPAEKKKPEPKPAAESWQCTCGAAVTGKFCPECGKPRPAADGWTCSCGAVNKGKFCAECGAKKPAGVPQAILAAAGLLGMNLTLAYPEGYDLHQEYMDYFNRVAPSSGAKLEITHDSASPLGIKVWAESEVTQVDGKRIVLKVAAYDEKGLIGQGVHERFIITNDRFLAKAGRKLEG